MIISREEAVELFNKWKTESTPLTGILVGDAAVRFSGVITELNPSGLVVSQTLPSGQTDEVMIGFHRVRSYDYQDSREAPPEIQEKVAGKIVSVLEMTFDTSTVMLYEKAQD